MFPAVEARAIANETGLAIHDHPDLLPHHLLLSRLGRSSCWRWRNWDEVSYIFPASPALVQRSAGAWLRGSTDGGWTGRTIGSAGRRAGMGQDKGARI